MVKLNHYPKNVDDVCLLDGRHPRAQGEHDVGPDDLLVVVERLLGHVELGDLGEQRQRRVVGQDAAVHEVRLGPEEGGRRAGRPRRLPHQLLGLVRRRLLCCQLCNETDLAATYCVSYYHVRYLHTWVVVIRNAQLGLR